MAITDEQLVGLLKEGDFVEQEKIDLAVKFSKEENIPLSQSLVDKDYISDENLGRLLSEYYKLPMASLGLESVDGSIINILPEEVAKTRNVVCFGIDNGLLKVATSNPDQGDFFTHIGQKVNRDVKLYFATDREVAKALDFYKVGIEKSFVALFEKKDDGTTKDIPVTKTVDLLIEYAHSSRASDIHIEPTEKASNIRFRVDGVLTEVLEIPKSAHEQVITRIKVMAKLRTDEHLSAQDGKIRTLVGDDQLDIRVSIVPIIAGEKVVMRLLSSKTRQFGLSDLGMSDDDHRKVKEASAKPYGMILSTGPTGSGKTTTVYSVLKILNTKEKNIATIEDPVEYEIEGVNQIQVNAKTNLTFANGLRAILRQDPNIIYVGEIRDQETADIATNSAMTGHLVLSTLHTNNAATTIPRLIDLGIEPFLVASTINVVIGQRLVRKICDGCKMSQDISIDELALKIPSIKKDKGLAKKKSIRVYSGKGCAICGKTGYKGRLGIFEVLVVSDELKKSIVERSDSDQIEKIAKSEGMKTMFDDGLDKVLAGKTTIEELLRVINE